jgi:ABC-2 type transport system ATP-binding protein
VADQESTQEKLLIARMLRKTYRGASSPALENFDISIGIGEIFGLLGPNGAGKTTAIGIMSSLFRPDNGSVTICGVDILKYPNQVRKLFGLVPQDVALYSNLTARENLSYFGRLYGLRGERLKQRVRECLEFVGLEERADKRVFTYSGGMKRRANLAAGILHSPRILFLDEPTVGIDAQSRNMILERLSVLKQSGTSMVYTTHYMEEAESLCSRIAVIDHGRIIAQGLPGELIEEHPGCSDLGALFLKLTGKQLRD